MMKNLSEQDGKNLLKWGYNNADIIQIDEAITNTIFTLTDEKINCQKRIGWQKARTLLGDTVFLSGIARSAYHWTAERVTNDNKIVNFDSSRLFK